MSCNDKVAALKKVALMNGTSEPLTNGFCTHEDDVTYAM